VAGVEWVEVRSKDVDSAVAAAVEELGLEGPDAADIEVLQKPERGFLGMGGQDAIVRVKPKQSSGGKRRRGGRGRGSGKTSGGGSGDTRNRSRSSEGKDRSRSSEGKAKAGNGSRSEGRGSGKSSSGRSPDAKKARTDQPRQQQRPQREPRRSNDSQQKKEPKVEVEVDRDEQATMVKDFLTGLLDAFGLEGEVQCTVEEDIILANVTGEQTEALVGAKGAILQAILELSRTIVQRKSQAGARIRLDIGGYTERRREALRIYTGRLVEKIMEEGGEIMLEPMNPADRKVVHDAAADLGGVKTFSEGEEPRRSVVISRIEE
jgi:spoIIIJ-associated protein